MKSRLTSYKVKFINANKNINIKSVWEEAKSKLSFREYCDFLVFLSKQKQYEYVFNLNEILYEIKDLMEPRRDLIINRTNNTTEQIIVNNILGVLAYLNLRADSLNELYKLKNKFERNILINDVEGATKIINSIERDYGISFWLIEATFLKNNYLDLKSSEKNYQEIKADCHDNDYLKEFIRCIHKRTSNLIKFEDTRNFIEKKQGKFQIACNDKKITLEEYTYFTFYNSFNQNYNVLNQLNLLLSICDYLSIVDLYNLIDKVTTIFLLDNSVSDYSKVKLLNAIKTISFNLSCSPILANNYETSIKNNPLTLKMFDVLKAFNCDLPKCSKLVKELLYEFPNEFDLILISCKLNILLGTDLEEIISNKCFLYELQNILLSLLKKDIHYNKFVAFEDKVYKYLYQLLNTSIFFAYRNFYLHLYSDEKEGIQEEYSYIFSKYYNVKSKFCSSLLTPVEKNNLYVTDWFQNIDLDTNYIYDSISLSIRQLNNCSIEELKEIVSESNNTNGEINCIIRNYTYEIYFDKLLNGNNLIDAISFYVNCSFKSKTLVKCFDLKKLINSLNRKIIEGLYSRIEFCVFADLVNLKGNRSLGYNILSCNSLEKILQRNHVRFPSELIIANGHEKLYSYLFRHVCSERLLHCYFSYNFESINEVTILQERVKLLESALKLDNDCEREQIQTQIANINDRILRLQILLPNEEKIEPHYLFKGNIRGIDDVRFLMRFIDTLSDLNFHNISLQDDGFIIVKELLINYKKIYFSLLDEQIGINIRHGFFSNEILRFFKNHNIFILKKEDEDKYSVNNAELLIRKQKQLINNNQNNLVDNVESIWQFSLALYNFIDKELDSMKISCVSSKKDDVFKIFIDDSTLFHIAEKIYVVKNPYELQKILWDEFDCVAENNLKNIRQYLNEQFFDELKIFCTKARGMFNIQPFIDDSEIQLLSNTVANWFSFYNDGNKKCSILSYLKGLKVKYKCLDLDPINSDDLELTMDQIHILDIIIKNLVFNAINHAAIDESKLRIVLKYELNPNEVKLIINNQLGEVNIEDIKSSINITEYCVTTRDYDKIFNMSTAGKGYKHIIKQLCSDLIEKDKWNISFNKELLPSQFEVMVNFIWKRGEDV